MTTENQKSDEKVFTYKERLCTMYRLAWSIKFYKRGAPIPGFVSKVMGSIAVFIGLIVLLPIILPILILSWIWMPFYPAWRAIWITPKATINVNRYLNELDKKKDGSADRSDRSSAPKKPNQGRRH